jgi:hypothetical protein
MKRLAILAALLVAACPLVAEQRGTVPRDSARLYPARATVEGVHLGARVMTKKETQDRFASDLASRCLVVEVAVYPDPGKPLAVSPTDFILRLAGTEVAARPERPAVLAAKLQKQAKSGRDVDFYPYFGVGYESGGFYDPMTGQRHGGGVTTTAGVGVGIGGAGSHPASTDRDRQVMQMELSDKGLPEGEFSKPVSGYLYFPVTWKEKKPAYRLEYLLNGKKAVLKLNP